MSSVVFGRRSTCEASYSIDVRLLHREGHLNSGQSFSVSWSVDGELVASIRARAEHDCLALTFDWSRAGTREWISVEQPVPIIWTKCHLGGCRPWFQCLAYFEGQYCGRRVAKLYIGDSPVFACRRCHALVYASQREGTGTRALQRAQKIRERLGGSSNLLEPFPEKPPRMHWRTYDRLRELAEIAEQRSNALLKAWVQNRYTPWKDDSRDC